MPSLLTDDFGRPAGQPQSLLADLAPVWPSLLGSSADLEDDPNDFTDRYNTPLSPAEEGQYQQWVAEQSKAQGHDLGRDTYDYDMRGFWKSGGGFDEESGHAGDTYKKPNHPTFSTQSKYHGVDGHAGGVWGGGEDGEPFTFTPSATNLKMMPLPDLQRYFASPAEAGRSVLVVPK